MDNKFTSQEMLEKLISFNSISYNSNLDLIKFVQDYLSEFGIESKIIYDETKTKANLFATIGPVDKSGVILSGHTDVVPVEGQDWSSDPFALREDNGKLYGRGTCDMKGFIAVVLAKMPEIISANIKTPIHLAFSYDEEVGCFGAHKIGDHIKEMEVEPFLCVVGEPTEMKPITGHKSAGDYTCSVHGLECHSSMAPSGVNAVEAGADIVSYIRSVAKRMASEGPFNNNFEPPFTTVHTGVIKGGTALNIVPNHCEIEFEIRAIPEQDPAELIQEIKDYAFRQIEPAMKAVNPKTGITFVENASVPAFDIDDNHKMVDFIKSLSGSNSTSKVSFATEAGIFQEAGVPTIVCGPGSIEQAHKPDEFIKISEILKCEAFIDRLVFALNAN